MNRRTLLASSLGGSLALLLSGFASAQDMDDTSRQSLDTVMAFMEAMGGGDMDKMSALMADDMVWHNEGDKSVPWIGPWKGKEQIFEFLGIFSKNFQTTQWENTDAFASADTVAVFGRMNAIITESGAETGEFSFALRAKVRDGQVILWHWFEDSYAISRAFHH
ncbi:nuclear transport factor 2 family protein [Granulosicoccus sp. 3-233]|uniref:nuclear transport factor 2 family protein n=1 Tax=Granulosicoccus sp. 3-233 TaxID=3417969 RepID=UPI003D33E5D8